MASSPFPTGHSGNGGGGGGWMGGSSHPQFQPQPPAAPERDDFGMRTRPMGVKVLYSFRDSLDNCLARWPQVMPIQTIPLDETSSIGVVDLRLCLQAIAQCSPEIVGQHEMDYTVYAYDYSETDTPLVGQGMFSRGLEPSQPNEEPKMVTGRVTKNLLAVFGGGARETLEVKLKLASVPKRQPQQQQYPQQPQQQVMNNAPTPTDTSEWNSFIQSNPNLGQCTNMGPAPPTNTAPSQPYYSQVPRSRPGSVPLAPAPRQGQAQPPNPNQLAPGAPQMPQTHPQQMHPQPHYLQQQQPQEQQQSQLQQPHEQQQQQQGSPFYPHNPHHHQQQLQPQPQQPQHEYQNHQRQQLQQHQSQEIPSDGFVPISARTGTPDIVEPMVAPVAKPSRPSSRASRSRAPTGRPRGRPPKKKPVADGNTSAAEDPTDVDDGSRRKRAKTTKADWSEDKAPMESTADSLRVVAATSGSLRAMRPVGAGIEGVSGSHLHEGPRAPTPVPQAQNDKKLPRQRKKPASTLSRRDSITSADGSIIYPNLPTESSMQMPTPQDARSPTESIAASEQVYTPDESPADLGSSPPVPRSVAYPCSSPMVSSPVLPRLPRPQQDSGFMSGGIEGPFDNEDLLSLPPQAPQSKQDDISSRLAPLAKPVPKKGGNSRPQYHGFPFQEVTPGPPELLPVTSLYNPPGQKRKVDANAPKPKRFNAEPRAQKTAAEEPQDQQTPPMSQLVDEVRPSVEEPSADSAITRLTPEEPLEPVALLREVSSQANVLEETPSVPEPELPAMKPPKTASRSGSSGSRSTPAAHETKSAPPASDPAGPSALLTLPQVSFSEAPCPPSDTIQEQSIANKNYVKKQTIKERLEQAIESGEMPPFCTNCGAIETPTWRKMWTQDHKGTPEFYDYSEKPGQVTAIDILERDGEGKPTSYRLVKKSLGPGEDKHKWVEMLLCNPCGIWLGKFKSHRPPDRWEKDQSRLNQPRRKRDPSKGSSNGSRSKRQRTKNDQQTTLTSEACYKTDPIGPSYDQADVDEEMADASQTATNMARKSGERVTEPTGSPNSRGPGSTHSRGSGTADSPIPVEDDLGQTRRLLFPSPRKDNMPKVLGEMAVNIVRTGPEFTRLKGGDKEVGLEDLKKVPVTPKLRDTDMADLFGTPPARPSTPTPNDSTSSSGPFKTPTRPTPSHRPITRSISKSIRSSARAILLSPSQALAGLQRTPCKTPGRSSVRQTPSRQNLHAHFAPDDMNLGAGGVCDSPFTATINQLLSEANDFTSGSPSHGLADLDQINAHFSTSAATMDFGSYLNTDMAMPSSPPLLMRGDGVSSSQAAAFEASWELWSQVDNDTAPTDGEGHSVEAPA
ncbi:hypothetical protein RB601_006597 [Gaeumannomyces tritici]